MPDNRAESNTIETSFICYFSILVNEIIDIEAIDTVVWLAWSNTLNTFNATKPMRSAPAAAAADARHETSQTFRMLSHSPFLSPLIFAICWHPQHSTANSPPRITSHPLNHRHSTNYVSQSKLTFLRRQHIEKLRVEELGVEELAWVLWGLTPLQEMLITHDDLSP